MVTTFGLENAGWGSKEKTRFGRTWPGRTEQRRSGVPGS
ncbi:hypothetical protein [Polaromonas sp. CG9_12]|nr:hypothetical protein [Polaromonas sp. CG9_12]